MSTLGQTVAPDQSSGDQPANISIPQQGPMPDVGEATPQAPTLAPQPSRLLSILGAIARVGTTALSGIPNSGRPSFVTGLGEGARAGLADNANQQAIKFKSFDDQLRAANLHHQDQELQMRSQEQQDAHQKMQDFQHDWNQDHGIDDTIVPNIGDAVVDHLTAQTSANGAASIPPGTHLSADGNSIHVPTDSQDTRDGQLQQYNTFGPALGLPSLPNGAKFVPPKLLDALTHAQQGYGIDGTPLNHDVLPQKIAALQSQRDQLKNSGKATPDTLTGLDNTLGILKANLKALDDHQDQVFAKQTQQKAAQEGAIAGAKAKAEQPYKMQLEAQKTKDKEDETAKKGDSTELNAVAFDPSYQNPDGSKGANVVMSKSDAAAKGLQHYKADPSTINTVVAGMNDVQNKLNQLADVVTDQQRMSQVQPGAAAALIHHDEGFSASIGAHGAGGSGGVSVPLSRFNEWNYNSAVKEANQATRDYVTAFLGAHEAITQLPRLQTFGKSNRMTEQQMHAATQLLPEPGDGPMANQKMTSLQGMLDPLRKQVPHMPGADTMPSWLEKRQQQRQQAGPSNLSKAIGNPIDIVNGLQPTR